jgi:ribose transport system ATP-binding protein
VSSTNPTAELPVVLSLQGVSKRFGTVQALRDVSVECRAGEIHAVVGENGSGKSTLLGIASGFLAPDEGTVEIGGTMLHAADAAHALRLGLGMAYQNYAQVLNISVAENLFLAMPAKQRPRYREMESWAAAQLADYDLDVQPGARTASLSLAQRQFLEVVKALLLEPKVLLLDEPTTALGPSEVEQLHAIVNRHAAAGVGVVYVSHRLPEVLGIADRVTVLRDGQTQGTHASSGMAEDDLVALMIGRPLELAFPSRDPEVTEAAEVLRIQGLRGRRLGPVDLSLHEGEILGIAGAEGNGQDELLRSLAGVDRANGEVSLDGSRVDLRSPSGALRAGIMLLSGERLRESLFPVLGMRSNSTVQVLKRFSRGGIMRRGAEREAVIQLVTRLKVRTPSVDQPVRFLSGGNQQKVSLTRPFLRDVRVVLADEPTQGVDVKSRFDIYEALRSKADQGVAMIVKSSDPLELAGLCDRVVVVSRGRIVDEIAAGDLSERRIVEGIVRGKAGSSPSAPTARPAPAEPAAPAVVSARPARRVPGWLPLALMIVLMLAIGGYAAGRSPDFLSSYNLNTLLGSSGALPLAIVAMGQTCALMVRGFDVSVGALMTLTVVVASFVMGDGSAWFTLLGASLALVGMGIVVGLVNAGLIRKVGLPSIIATLATLSVMQGLSLKLRPVPGGEINFDVADALNRSWSFVPIAFVVAVAVALVGDHWLYRTAGGLTARAVGMDEDSARRLGAPSERVSWRAFVLSSLGATLAGFFLAAQVGIGDARVGSSFALTSIAAAVLGGASLAGGRGSFVGAIVGALFLSLIINILPLPNILPGFLREWSDALPLISMGALTLLALIVYQGPELWARVHAARASMRSRRAMTATNP